MGASFRTCGKVGEDGAKGGGLLSIVALTHPVIRLADQPAIRSHHSVFSKQPSAVLEGMTDLPRDEILIPHLSSCVGSYKIFKPKSQFLNQ